MPTESELVNDLLQSPPAPRAAHRPSIVTVDDIRVDALTCWICQDGTDDLDSDTEEEVVEQAENRVSDASKRSKGRRRKAGRNRRFVHACNCTLVAHERCLLHWINRKSSPAQPAVRCPQCAHPYRLVSPPPTLLSVFERANSHLPRVVWTGVAAVTGTAVGYVCYGYGRLMLRAWMGHEAAEKFAEVRAGLVSEQRRRQAHEEGEKELTPGTSHRSVHRLLSLPRAAHFRPCSITNWSRALSPTGEQA